MKSGVFVTGTSTDIGKTFICSLIVAAAMISKINIHYFKPIQTGDDSDCETVKKFTGLTETNIIHPVFKLKAPLSPYDAAQIENITIDPQKIINEYKKIKHVFHILEGAGGLLVPITKNFLIRDLIKELNLPLIIVATTKLGTINHTLLTIEAAFAKNLNVLGIVLNGEYNEALIHTLNEFSSLPILATVPWLNDASNFFKQADHLKHLLKIIFPQTTLTH